jgi:hypothetical protein
MGMFRRWFEKAFSRPSETSTRETKAPLILPADPETYLVQPDGKVRVLAWAVSETETIALGPEGPMPLTDGARFQFPTYGGGK